jgi:DNA-binding transcriptional ArsR family regulator
MFRLRFLRALMEEPLTVSELMGSTGMKQGNVSKHLGVLVSGSAVGFEMAERNVPASRAVRHHPAGYE